MIYITATELKDRMDKGVNFTLLDVREPYEYEICSIGGTQIPMAEVPGRVSELDSTNEIVVMCKSGRRAEAVANLLIADIGMKNILILEGGILSWIENIDNSLEAY